MVTLNVSGSSYNPLCMSMISSNLPRIHHVTLGTGYVILSIVTIFSNAILIYTLYKTRQLNTISNKLTLFMNISDLCLGCIAFITSAFINLRRDTFKSCTIEKVLTCFMIIFGSFSGIMIVFISIDRYFRVMKLNRYNLYMNNFRMKLMVIIDLILSGIIAALATFYPSFAQQVSCAVFGSTVIFVAVVVYAVLFRRLKKHVQRREILVMSRSFSNTGSGKRALGLEVPHVDITANNRSQEDKHSQLSSVKTLKFLLIYIVIVYTPFEIMSCVWTYYRFLRKTEPRLYINVLFVWSIFAAMFNASGNSWIILYVNTRSRRFVSTLFRRGHFEESVGDTGGKQFVHSGTTVRNWKSSAQKAE